MVEANGPMVEADKIQDSRNVIEPGSSRKSVKTSKGPDGILVGSKGHQETDRVL
jgi:hypothetical protein